MKAYFFCLLFFFPIFSFGQRDLKIEGFKTDELMLIGMPFDDLLVGETKSQFPFEHNYGAYVHKLYHPKTGKVCGYLPHNHNNIEHTFHIRDKKLHNSGNYLVFMGFNSISVYTKMGKFLRDIPRKYQISNNQFVDFSFSSDFKQVCYIQEGDIFVASLDLASGKISNQKQITFVGNFVENYAGRIHLFQSNKILANSSSEKMFWIDVNTGDSKETAFDSKYLKSIFDGGFTNKYYVDSLQTRTIMFQDFYFNENGRSYVYGYDLESNVAFEMISSPKPAEFTRHTFISSSNNLLQGFFVLLYYKEDKYLTKYDLRGNELSRFILPNNWSGAQNDNPIFLSPSKSYWARGVNKNGMTSSANNTKNEVVNLQTGEVQQFIDSKYKISQIGWASDNLMIFSVLESSTFILGTNDYNYPTSDIGTLRWFKKTAHFFA